MTDHADLLDLLRLACRQGKMRLNVWHGSEHGHQANLANSGDGWTVDTDRDPLVAIENVLRIRFGKQLERQRASDTSNVVHIAHQDDSRQQLSGVTDMVEDDDCEKFDNNEIADAIAFALSRMGFADAVIERAAAAVIDRLYGPDRTSSENLCEVTMTTAAPQQVDEFEALL